MALMAIFVVSYWAEIAEFAGMSEPSVSIPAVPPAEKLPEGQVGDEVMEVSTLPASAPKQQPEPVAAVLPALPELDHSDQYVREQLEQWALPEPWLQRKQLIARGASVLANAAAGRVPYRQLDYLIPTTPFPVVQRGDRYFVDPSGPARYDNYVTLLTAVPPARAAALFQRFSPLVSEALAQLGERRSPRVLLKRAIDTFVNRARGLPGLSEETELLRPNLTYIYADPGLESLPDLDKLMLRMGRQNVSKLADYLVEIKELI